ncbi:MAG: hypothetical protein AVO39_10300 [delta proteobacterium MLS_D]|jgi:hypothetical protein|nr:MAG: hypothetical protein AVO39_10300 [delta proteobacterium MLS_D]
MEERDEQTQKRAERICREWETLKSNRGQWEGHWNDVATYVAPRKAGIFEAPTVGGKRMTRVYDSTAIQSCSKFASGLYGNLCPPDQRWFELRAPAPDLEVAEEQRHWYSEATRILHEELAISNFGLSIHEDFKDLGWCGTGGMTVEEGDPGKPTLRFRTMHIRQYIPIENAQVQIDRAFRLLSFTASQAIDEFGEMNLHPEITGSQADPQKASRRWQFIHLVEPRRDRNEEKRDDQNMPYASYYVDVKHKTLIEEGGYEEMPIICHRLDCEEPTEVYGRSPAMQVLPEIKVLNRMVRASLLAEEKRADPPLDVPEGNYPFGLRTGPGGINYYRDFAKGRVTPMEISGSVETILKMKEQRRQRIKEAFFLDLFLLLDQLDQNQKTATEILERVKEKLLILGPMLGRLQSELFNPLIDRCIGILFRAGKLPPVPEGVAFYEIEYVSQLALAMRMIEVSAVTQTIAQVQPFIEMNPDVMDNFDDDAIVRGVYERMGGNPKWLRDTDARAEIRKQRLEQQQAMQALEAGGQAADMLPKAGKKAEEGSPLAEMMKVAGGL